MFEFLALFALAGVGLAVLAVLFVVGFVLKLTFRLLLLPLVLVGGLVKILGLVALLVVGVVLAPVVFGLFVLLALPVLVILGLFGIGWAVAAA